MTSKLSGRESEHLAKLQSRAHGRRNADVNSIQMSIKQTHGKSSPTPGVTQTCPRGGGQAGAPETGLNGTGWWSGTAERF